ncbi:MAG: DUF2628 domain-containing protein [Firmicutes bacterium]|nr:DUF2628 domain-containing protein [Bacillota bacterium]
MDNNKKSSNNPINLTDLNKLAFSMLENSVKENKTEEIKKELKPEVKKYESTVHELFDLPKKKSEHIDTFEEKIEESVNNKINDIDLNFDNIEISSDKEEEKKDVNEVKIDYQKNSFQAVPMDVDYVDPTITIPVVPDGEILPKNNEIEEAKVTNEVLEKKENVDEELLEDYIGNNYNKIKNRIINFSALFLGPFYYLYRKLYIIGLFLLIFQTLIIYFIKNIKYFIVIEITYLLILSLLFNTLYLVITKKNIKKIQSAADEKIIKERCILKGGTDLLISSLISTGYIILIVLFLATSLFNFFSKIVDLDKIFNQKEKDKVSTNATDFANMLESYSATARLNIDEPGTYTYLLNDEELVFIALPQALDEKNIYCVKSNKDSHWEDKEGFEVKENSTTCDEFMDDLINNYSKFYKIKLPDSGELILSSQGKIQNNSKIVYGNKICKYDLKEKEFVCK